MAEKWTNLIAENQTALPSTADLGLKAWVCREVDGFTIESWYLTRAELEQEIQKRFQAGEDATAFQAALAKLDLLSPAK